MPNESLVVKGAREHNLKDVSISIPRGSISVFCGLSGSGKSSLAFDTIFAEGQRRYVESLSSYARQFLGQLDKPDVDSIDGLSPAVSIDQKSTSKNPRSTVGTVTEVWDYLRLLWARVGVPHCPLCDTVVSASSATQIADQILADEALLGHAVMVLAPVIRDRKGSHEALYTDMISKGYTRARTDGVVHRLTEPPTLERYENHRIEVVVDRLTVNDERRGRLVDALEGALRLSEGFVRVVHDDITRDYSEMLVCPVDGTTLGELEPRSFSFNSPYGACVSCDGLGSKLEVDDELVVPDTRKSLRDDAVMPWASKSSNHHVRLLEALTAHHKVSMDTPFAQLPDAVKDAVFNGSGDVTVKTRWAGRYGREREYTAKFEGIKPWVRRKHGEVGDSMRERLEGYMRPVACRSCAGTRLRPEVLGVRVGERSIASVSELPVKELLSFFDELELNAGAKLVGERVLKEICERLGFLNQVGLGYLTLGRASASLSGGEAQRIRLATQIGSGLTGVLYVLDEPSIGLHQRDNAKLITTLERLKALGNTLIVVEHDEETIEAADYIVEVGPGAGELGGEVVYQGPVKGLLKSRKSVTGAYLSGRRAITTPSTRRAGNGKELVIRGVREHNVRNVDVTIPLGMMVAVTGVSGSGKSTVINDVLASSLVRQLHGARTVPGKHDGIDGVDALDKAVIINQSPIGRTPRSNPATYTGVFDKVRTLFSESMDAKKKGYGPGRFSFNVKGGRCENCRGDGTIKVEMNFLPDVYVQCEVCKGARYNRETLEVKYKGKSISEVLNMTISDALTFFGPVPSIKRQLETLNNVGLGYVRLGQSATTLSGGEAQRVKLASELQRRATGKTVYILDEPTTGLHFEDVKKLLEVLHKLTDAGNSIILIEHNLDVIRNADFVVDMGPEGGPDGGLVVDAGTPEDLAGRADTTGSHTGGYLKKALALAETRGSKTKK